MSGWTLAGLILAGLMVVDGLVSLLFLERVEGLVQRMFPGLKVAPIAIAELLGGAVALLLLLPG